VSVVADTREVAACSLRREDFSSVAADYVTRILEVELNICVQIGLSVWKWRTNDTEEGSANKTGHKVQCQPLQPAVRIGAAMGFDGAAEVELKLCVELDEPMLADPMTTEHNYDECCATSIQCNWRLVAEPNQVKPREMMSWNQCTWNASISVVSRTPPTWWLQRGSLP
jgi:hypothetical protein